MELSGSRWRIALLTALPVAGIAGLLAYGPMPQDQVLPNYHRFADQRTLWGVPNFWNVVSNLPFVAVAAWGWCAANSTTGLLENWERLAYRILLIALVLVAIGSGYYHTWPNNATLFWDRLPMALAFMAVLAATIGERVSARGGRLLLFPLLATGAVSVLYWRATDDLRLYVLIQFTAVIALPLMLLLFRPRHSGTAGVAAMVVLYALALALDRLDRQVASITSAGGHPWKHVAAALAMLCYVETIAHRQPRKNRSGTSIAACAAESKNC